MFLFFFSGLILRISLWGNISEDEKFDDSIHWELEGEERDASSANKDGNGRNSEQLSMGHI